MGIVTGKRAGPRKVMLYAAHGVGKSTFAAGAPDPLFLDIEQGTNDLDIARWDEPITSFNQFGGILAWVRAQQHEFKTLVIDTIDWLERLMAADITAAAGKETLADIDFGKGAPRLLPKWERVLTVLDAIHRERNMGIILLAHARVEKVTPPDGTAYDRYSPDLWTNARNEGVGNFIQEWCTEVFFARLKKVTVTEGKGFNERARAIGTQEREMLTTDSAWASAKNRLGMPGVVPMTWEVYRDYIVKNRPSAPPSAVPIEGLVTEGSSKPQPSPEAVAGLAEMNEMFSKSA